MSGVFIHRHNPQHSVPSIAHRNSAAVIFGVAPSIEHSVGVLLIGNGLQYIGRIVCLGGVGPHHRLIRMVDNLVVQIVKGDITTIAYDNIPQNLLHVGDIKVNSHHAFYLPVDKNGAGYGYRVPATIGAGVGLRYNGILLACDKFVPGTGAQVNFPRCKQGAVALE